MIKLLMNLLWIRKSLKFNTFYAISQTKFVQITHLFSIEHVNFRQLFTQFVSEIFNVAEEKIVLNVKDQDSKRIWIEITE